MADELSATTLAELPQDRLVVLSCAMALPTPMLRSWYVRWDTYRDGRGYSAFGTASSDAVVDGYRGELLVDPEPVLLQEISG